MKKILGLAPLVLALGVLAAPASAQPCGPLNFAFATTGAGCAPFGGGIPTLAGSIAPVSPTACPVVLTVTTPPSPLPIPATVVLAIGASNPMLDLTGSGFPGCILRASLDVILAVPLVGPSTYSVTVPVAPLPVFVGASAYCQAAAVSIGLGGITASLTNGISVSL